MGFCPWNVGSPNSVLHNTKLEASHVMHDAEINDAIIKLYEKVKTYSAEDWWYFDVLLAIQLHKPLWSRQWWLVNARIPANKSEMMMNQYFAHLLSIRTVQNAPLERIGSLWEYFQMNLLNLFGACTLGPGWKIPSCLLWLCISLLYLRWCRQATKLSFLLKDVV
jgi:hypothetical protein